jgi:hypothetical protein
MGGGGGEALEVVPSGVRRGSGRQGLLGGARCLAGVGAGGGGGIDGGVDIYTLHVFVYHTPTVYKGKNAVGVCCGGGVGVVGKAPPLPFPGSTDVLNSCDQYLDSAASSSFKETLYE